LDPHRQAGFFARRQTERARRAWFESAQGDQERLWNEYRRREMGARAEEAAGRFLELLDGWEGAKVFHAVEFRGADLPHGDVDHLVIFDRHEFALVVESKYRLGRDVEETHLPRLIQYTQAVGEVLGIATWPVLCQSLPALRDDPHDESIIRRWTRDGNALLCDAEYLPRSILEIVRDLDAFQAGPWRFPDQRPQPQPAETAPTPAPAISTPATDKAPHRQPLPARPPQTGDNGSLAWRVAVALWWVPSLLALPFISWIIAALLSHSRRYLIPAVAYAALLVVVGLVDNPGLVDAYWLMGFLHVVCQHRPVKADATARAQQAAFTARS
jgi:hypothetical protein